VSFDTLGDVNWLAAIVAGIVYYAVGAAWYSPALFGKPWMRSIGWDVEAGPPDASAADYALPLVAYLVAGIATAMLAVATATDTFGEGIVLGLVLGVGIATVLAFVTAVFDPKKVSHMVWFGVTAGYHALGLLITAVIVGVWS
jgi:hypothetical protein